MYSAYFESVTGEDEGKMGARLESVHEENLIERRMAKPIVSRA